jgi:hypothetical protein
MYCDATSFVSLENYFDLKKEVQFVYGVLFFSQFTLWVTYKVVVPFEKQWPTWISALLCTCSPGLQVVHL